MKTFKELKTNYLEEFGKLIGARRRDDYKVAIGPITVSAKYDEYCTPTFISRREEIFENHAIISFQYKETVYVDNIVREASKLSFEYGKSCNVLPYFDLMKSYWLDYAKVKNLEGVIFIGHESIFDVRFVEYFNKHHSNNFRCTTLEQIIKNYTDCTVFYADVSNTLLKKIDNFNRLKNTLSQLVEVQPLLSSYIIDFHNLFYKEIEIDFMGVSIRVSSSLSNEFSSLNLIGKVDEDETEDKTVTFSLGDKGLYEYFEEILTNNRFKVLLSSSLDSIRNIYKKLDYYLVEPGPRHQDNLPRYEAYMHKMQEAYDKVLAGGSWESGEVELALILDQIKAGKTKMIVDSYNDKTEFRLQIYQFRTNSAYYYFATSRSYYPKNDDFRHSNNDSFDLFISETEECVDLKEYIISQTITF